MRLEAFFTQEDLIALAIESLRAKGYAPVAGRNPIFAPYEKGEGEEQPSPKKDKAMLAISVEPAAPLPSYLPIKAVPPLLEGKKPRGKKPKEEVLEGQYNPPQVEKRDGRRGAWERMTPEQREARKVALQAGRVKRRMEAAPVPTTDTLAPPLLPPPPPSPPQEPGQEVSQPAVKRPEVVASSIMPFPDPVSAS